MSEESAKTADLFEIFRTTRSMRRLKPDPVPDELIRKILEAGVCAPSGGNMQRWRFLVIRDAKTKETVGAYYKRAWEVEAAFGLPPGVHSYACCRSATPWAALCQSARRARRCRLEDRWGDPYRD
jgi:nitroreductase